MSVRILESRVTTTAQANKIPVLQPADSMGSLDGSQLTNLVIQAPANSKTVSFGETVQGGNVVNIVKNTIYACDGLFESANGIFQFTDAFANSCENGDVVGFWAGDDGKPYVVNASSNSATHVWIAQSGQRIPTATSTGLKISRGELILFRAHRHPLTNYVHLHPTTYYLNSLNDLADVDFGNSITRKKTVRYNPISQKWEQADTMARKEIVITDANIMNYISYDRFFEGTTRETDGPYLRISQMNLEATDGSFDNLMIFWQATNLTINSAIVPFTEAKVVLPNINSYWGMKSIYVMLDNTDITLRCILEKDAAVKDNQTFIENANYTTTPTVENINNLVLNLNSPKNYRPALRFLGCDTTFIASYPDAPAGTKSWIII